MIYEYNKYFLQYSLKEFILIRNLGHFLININYDECKRQINNNIIKIIKNNYI